MNKYKVNTKGNKKFFVTCKTLKEAQAMAREHARKSGEVMEIKESRGARWFKLEEITK